MIKMVKAGMALLVFGLFFSNAPLAFAGPCGDLGGDCYVSCTAAKLTPLPSGNSGCVTTSGHECCRKSSDSAGTEIIPNDRGQKATGDYKLNDFLQLAVNVAKWIEGIVGSLALLMFVYGGFTLLLSQGSSDKVAKGKSIIVGAVIGLVIVFTSWSIINFIVKGIGGSDEWYVSK
jgi:hypothetical protein